MTKNAYLAMEIMLIRSKMDHLFAFFLFTENGVCSHCSEFILTSRQYYHIASSFVSSLYLLGSLYIKVLIEK